VAASLFLAVFFTVNFNTNQEQLEPNFQVLFDPNNIDFKALSEQQRLVKFTLAAPISSSEMDALMNKHQLQQLNQADGNSDIIAQTNKTIDETKLAKLKADRLIEDIELLKF